MRELDSHELDQISGGQDRGLDWKRIAAEAGLAVLDAISILLRGRRGR